MTSACSCVLTLYGDRIVLQAVLKYLQSKFSRLSKAEEAFARDVMQKNAACEALQTQVNRLADAVNRVLSTKHLRAGQPSSTQGVDDIASHPLFHGIQQQLQLHTDLILQARRLVLVWDRPAVLRVNGCLPVWMHSNVSEAQRLLGEVEKKHLLNAEVAEKLASLKRFQ